MTNVFAIVNQKGGVGKTTTTVNLGTALAAVGKKTLIVDLDPQGNATTGLGFTSKEDMKSSYDLLVSPKSFNDILKQTSIPLLDIIPSNQNLSGAEIELAKFRKGSRELLLKQNLTPYVRDYDFVLIDCPPSLGLLTVNALAAVSKVLVPLQCEFYALEGLSQLIKTIRIVQSKINPELSLEGIVLTMFDTRSSLSTQVANDVRTHLGSKVYNTLIPRNIRMAEAPSFGKPAIVYDTKCLGSQAYMELAKELLIREGEQAA